MFLAAATLMTAMPQPEAFADPGLRLRRPGEANTTGGMSIGSPQSGSQYNATATGNADWTQDFSSSQRQDLGNQNIRTVVPIKPRQDNTWKSGLQDFASDPAPPPPVQQSAPERGMPRTTTTLSLPELRLLTSRDIVLVIDKSGSMETRDCPTNSSMPWQLRLPLSIISGGGVNRATRWEWCAQQSMDLAQQTAQLSPGGLTIVLFADYARVFERVNPRSIPLIFSNNTPGGGTNMASAVKGQLSDYMRRKSHGRTKPLVMAVISDGAASNPGAVRDAIEAAANRIDNPREIAITFLQVGNDRKGSGDIQRMDHQLSNARFDIVHSRSFSELQHTGLARALVDAVRN